MLNNSLLRFVYDRYIGRMEEHTVKIISTGSLTHDVKILQVEKPAGYSFIPGQATDVSVNTPEQEDIETLTSQIHELMLFHVYE